MTQEEIEEGNHLIAAYMGYEVGGTVNGGEIAVYYAPENCPEYVGMITPDQLKFHTLWDWLMPVVEKIEDTGFTCSINRANISVQDTNSASPAGYQYVPFQKGQKIEATWKAVVGYITWNNENK